MKPVKRYTIYFGIFVIAFLLYADTLGHGYALDDKMMFFDNAFVQRGCAGIRDILRYDSMAGMWGVDIHSIEGGRYRPLSLITFALEVELFGHEIQSPTAKTTFLGNPFVSHFINVVLYALLCVFLLFVLNKIFKDVGHRYRYLSIPVIATLLFACHPLHTEIVANVKGRDELLALFFSLAALNAVVNYCDSRKIVNLPAAAMFLFLGALSKEIALTFVALIPVTLYFFRKVPVRTYITTTAVLLTGALAYWGIRSAVIANQMQINATLLMNNPFLGLTLSQRYATVVLTLLMYLKLIVFPHPLTWDYYPYQIPIVGWTDWRVILSLVIHILLVIVVAKGWRKRSVTAYGIMLYAITLSITSNIVFNIGVFMSERFVFVSLLGFCLIFAHILVDILPKIISGERLYKRFSLTLLCVILVLFSIKTVTRNLDWRDNGTLFSHDVHVSEHSAKSNASWGSELYNAAEAAEVAGDTALRNKYFVEAIPYFEKALDIYPDYDEALVRLGNIHYKMYGDYKTMFRYYMKTLEASPLHKDVWDNTVGVLTHNVDEPEYEKYVWKQYARLSPSYYRSYLELGNLYYAARPQANDSAIFWYEQAKTLFSGDFGLLYNLGLSYGNIGDFVNAEANLAAALQYGENADVYKFLGIIKGLHGDDAAALRYFEQALALAPSDEQIKANIAIAKSKLNDEAANGK